MRIPIVFLLWLLVWVADGSPVQALVAKPQPQQARNIDARVDYNRTFAATPRQGQQEGIQGMRDQAPGIAVTYDRTTGATRTLLSRDGYLTAEKSTADALTIAQEFVAAYYEHMGLTSEDLADYEVTDEVYSAVTGTTRIYMRQVYLGLPVYNGQLHINISGDGRIMSVNNTCMPDIAAAANSNVPTLSAGDAVAAVANHLGVQLNGPPEVISTERLRTGVKLILRSGLSRKNIEARLMWLPIRAGEARLVWNFQVATLDDQHVYDFTVDAATRKIWTRFDWVAQDSYRVFPAPVESPNHALVLPPADGRQIVTDPADPVASPFGWHDIDGLPGAEFTIHQGNNVHAYDDINDTNGGICTSTPSPPTVEPDCGGLLDCDFDFDIDFATQDPLTYTSAAVTNLFYWNNFIHDIQYLYGFDEVAGNFQANNYGAGGAQGDYVLAEAQDGSGTNNANFCTPPDGQRPRMQMFNWNRTNPRRDGDFDNGIIVHEYGHGISNRLVGGPSNVSCLQNNQQPGEGLSDWWLLVYTAQASHQGTDPRGVGTYARGDAIDGPGVRVQRYSTDPAINTHTYESINAMRIPHGVGEVWAQAAWEVYWALVDAHGFDPNLKNIAGGAGNVRAMLYVNEGLKNTICSPTFTDVRDGIIQAAASTFGGEDVCLLWETFAAFGLGSDAVSGGPNSTAPTNGFEVPQSCPGLPIINIETSIPTANEVGPTSGQFTIIRTRDSVPPVTVFYSVSGTATPDADYVALSGEVNIPAGSQTATISVDAIDDLLVEDEETVIVTITPDPGYDIGANTATVRVLSEETLPVVTITATIGEATEVPLASGEFTITRTGNFLPAQSIFFSVSGDATPGVDYVQLPTSIFFADGQTTASFSVDPFDDPEIERAEEVQINLLPDPDYEIPNPFAGRASVFIVSDESPPVISAHTTTLFAFEAGEVPGEYTVTRSGDVSRAGPVFYQFVGANGAGVDFHAPPGVINFAAGQTTATVPMVPIDDNVIERDELVFMELTPHPDYDTNTFRPNVNIQSDEIIPEISITASDPSASEDGPTSGAFTITRTLNTSAASFIDINYSGTATSGVDYATLPATVTMGIGVSSIDIVVNPLPDGEVEADETVIATLPFRTLYVIAPPDNATVTILSGPAPPPNTPPVAVATATPTTGDAPLTVAFSSVGSSDSDGTITAFVWDFGDGSLNSTQANPTDTYTSDGSFTAVLTVTDNDGATNSANVIVTVNPATPSDTTPPTVILTNPAGGATVSATVTITADASDSSGITQVQFLVDGVLLSTDTTTPYSASWDTTATSNGAHNLTAQATDGAGNVGTSAAVNVTVDNSALPAPELSLSVSGVPANINRGDEFTATATVTNTGGATASGATVTVTWSPGQMLRLENPRNPTQSVASVAPGGSSSVSWLMQGDKEGSGTITFMLEDSGGATVDVVTQSITVIKGFVARITRE